MKSTTEHKATTTAGSPHPTIQYLMKIPLESEGCLLVSVTDKEQRKDKEREKSMSKIGDKIDHFISCRGNFLIPFKIALRVVMFHYPCRRVHRFVVI